MWRSTQHQTYQQMCQAKKQRKLWKDHLEQNKTYWQRSDLKRGKKEMMSAADNDHQHYKEWVLYNLLSKMATRCNGKWKNAKGKEIGAKEKKTLLFYVSERSRIKPF